MTDFPAALKLPVAMVGFGVQRLSGALSMAASFVRESAGAVGSVATAESRRLLREQFGNILDVIGFLNHVDAPSELSADGTYPIDEMIDRQYARGHFPAPWLIEGLGECYAEAYMKEGKPVHGLLSRGAGADLPDKTQLMMHAGMGIAFAKRLMTRLTPFSSGDEIDDALKTFLDMVEYNSQERYKGAALESLGYVARTWYGQMVRRVYRHLVLMDEPASEFFWHGAGRAMYRSPMHLLPGFSPFYAADHEPPNEPARLKARAGVAWAFTLVNMRQPEIMANLLSHRSEEISGNDAFTDGVYSALIMAGETVPGHRFVTGFCRYRPDRREESAVDAWSRHIGSAVGRIGNPRPIGNRPLPTVVT